MSWAEEAFKAVVLLYAYWILFPIAIINPPRFGDNNPDWEDWIFDESCRNLQLPGNIFDYYVESIMTALPCKPCANLRFKDKFRKNGKELFNQMNEYTLASLFGYDRPSNLADALRGYNIFKASPNDGPVDEGFAKAIFLLDYDTVS